MYHSTKILTLKVTHLSIFICRMHGVCNVILAFIYQHIATLYMLLLYVYTGIIKSYEFKMVVGIVVGLFLWSDKNPLLTKVSKSCNLASNVYFQCLNTFLGLIAVYQ